MIPDLGRWFAVSEGDPRALALYLRHYSSRRSTHRPGERGNYARFTGPGEKLLLLTVNADALFTWRRSRRQDGEIGINCAVFRNESKHLSSDLIREADTLAFGRWPGERHFTFVDPVRVRHKRDPGRCFVKAGWSKTSRVTGRGLLTFELMA